MGMDFIDYNKLLQYMHFSQKNFIANTVSLCFSNNIWMAITTNTNYSRFPEMVSIFHV